MDRMKDMVALVTGGSRGLGRAIAKEYAREGAKVVVCARSQSPAGLPGTLEQTVKDIQDQGGEALPVACDVSDEAQVSDLVQQVIDRYGRIDVLVNNAGIMVLGETGGRRHLARRAGCHLRDDLRRHRRGSSQYRRRRNKKSSLWPVQWRSRPASYV